MSNLQVLENLILKKWLSIELKANKFKIMHTFNKT